MNTKHDLTINGKSMSDEKHTELARIEIKIDSSEIKKNETAALIVGGDEIALTVHDNGSSDSYELPRDVLIPQRPKHKRYHSLIDPATEIYELPRDILVAYFLIRLETNGKETLWGKYSLCGKLGIACAVLTPILIQYAVACILVTHLEFWTALEKITHVGESSIYYNCISLVILFIYMFRDVHGYTSNVWKFIGRVEEELNVEYNPLHLSRLKNIGKVVKRFNYHQLDPRQINIKKQRMRYMFINFRIYIIAVFVLYGILTFYSLVQIAYTDDLADKLEVSLGIFFLLELDDWSYDLFISQNGILEDSQFDVEFPLILEKKENKFGRDTKKLCCSLWIVYGSLILVIFYSVILEVP